MPRCGAAADGCCGKGLPFAAPASGARTCSLSCSGGCRQRGPPARPLQRLCLGSFRGRRSGRHEPKLLGGRGEGGDGRQQQQRKRRRELLPGRRGRRGTAGRGRSGGGGSRCPGGARGRRLQGEGRGTGRKAEELNFPEAGFLQVGAGARRSQAGAAAGRETRSSLGEALPRSWRHLARARSLPTPTPLSGDMFSSHPFILGWREGSSVHPASPCNRSEAWVPEVSTATKTRARACVADTEMPGVLERSPQSCP